jgi:hypothetical protein
MYGVTVPENVDTTLVHIHKHVYRLEDPVPKRRVLVSRIPEDGKVQKPSNSGCVPMFS